MCPQSQPFHWIYLVSAHWNKGLHVYNLYDLHDYPIASILKTFLNLSIYLFIVPNLEWVRCEPLLVELEVNTKDGLL